MIYTHIYLDIFFIVTFSLLKCVAVLIYHYRASRPKVRPPVSLRRAVHYYYQEMCNKLGLYKPSRGHHTTNQVLPPVSRRGIISINIVLIFIVFQYNINVVFAL